MADERRLLDFRADHDPRRVAEEEDRDIEAVAELHEPGRLVGPVGGDGAAIVLRVVRDDADRPAFDAGEGNDHALPESPANFEDTAAVGHRRDDVARVVDAETVLRDDVAKRPLIGGVPLLQRPLEVGEVLLRDGHGFGFVFDGDIDHAVGDLDVHRADVFRGEDAEAAAFDHGRAAHADV